MTRETVIVLAVAMLALGASAQTPPNPTAEEASMRGFGDSDKTCQEWTDACVTCQRSDTGEPLCSNIGIACQPKAISCTRRAEEKK